MQEDLEWRSDTSIQENEFLCVKDSNAKKGMVFKRFNHPGYVGSDWGATNQLYYADNKEELKSLIYTMVRLG